MNKKFVFVFIIIVMFIFILTLFINNDSTTISEISQNDEKKILEYLDTKTNDISSPSKGKMYSSYDLLGIEENKIYIWLVKEEYITKDHAESKGNIVACPVVLYATKNNNNELLIENHNFPEDGKNYGKNLKRFFPENIIEKIDHTVTDTLLENIKIRVQEETSRIKK
ncbi:hypothetical protein SH1V18_40310 [Vallitalea longa]|uniref:Uncharacterized protein n=1 Tax=Vallitalea longa TaxID=2936439 RepID=A0A9W5YF58_9FIRM|nr:hypothetical protein [Vallitalea longa]GKX31551.1 hypothetical protein SH1V18_40310 [Vallitalea longa]